jgi:hypothetical protein
VLDPVTTLRKGKVAQMAKSPQPKSPRKASPPAPAKTTEADKPEAALLRPLNFRVPTEFHREFKTFAAQHSKKMVEVLLEAFALLKEKHGS